MVLKTRDAQLVRPTAADATSFLAAVARSAAHLQPWMSLPATPSKFKGYLDVLARDDHLGYLVLTPDHDLAGVVTISQIVRGCFHSGYLAYAGFLPFLGQGWMSAGLGAVLSDAFGELGLHRLEANIQPGNQASIALVRRLGFTREGYSRRYLRIDGEWRDHERWAILADDWFSTPA